MKTLTTFRYFRHKYSFNYIICLNLNFEVLLINNSMELKDVFVSNFIIMPSPTHIGTIILTYLLVITLLYVTELH